MLINGEKYACEACVRGHRVSNCQHSDRPLQHINKKGRPVSQCNHCRSMRFSRSAHVKCDCGERTTKCAHLQQTLNGHKETCCCNHGGRCTCTHKKDSSLDLMPELDNARDGRAIAAALTPKVSLRRRRPHIVQSAGNLAGSRLSRQHRVTPSYSKALHARVTSVPDGSIPHTPEDEPRSHFHHLRIATPAYDLRRIRSETTSPLLPAYSFPASMSEPSYSTTAVWPAGFPSQSDNGVVGAFDPDPVVLPDPGTNFLSTSLCPAPTDWRHHLQLSQQRGSFAPTSFDHTPSQDARGCFNSSSVTNHPSGALRTFSICGGVPEVGEMTNQPAATYTGLLSDTNGFHHQLNHVANALALTPEPPDHHFFKQPDNLRMTATGTPVSMEGDNLALWMARYGDDLAAPGGHSSAALTTSSSMSGFWDAGLGSI